MLKVGGLVTYDIPHYNKCSIGIITKINYRTFRVEVFWLKKYNNNKTIPICNITDELHISWLKKIT